jgi:hypothetical protein
MDQRVRVREMLRDLRFAHTRGDDVGTGAGAGAGADPTASFFAPPSHASAASFAAGSTRPSPVATPVFAHQRAMVGGGRNAPSKGSAGGHRDAAAVATWVASVLALAGVFLVIGQWVDERLMDDEASATVGTDYATVALKTCFQIAFDVALLVVPYLLLVRYAADSLLRQYYYLVVFPLWVLSLHAQGHLRERLRVLVAGEAEADDATKLARLVGRGAAHGPGGAAGVRGGGSFKKKQLPRTCYVTSICPANTERLLIPTQAWIVRRDAVSSASAGDLPRRSSR